MLSGFKFKIKSIFHLVSDSFMDSLIFIGQAVIHWAMLSSGITSSEILQLDLRLLLDSWRTPFSEKKMMFWPIRSTGFRIFRTSQIDFLVKKLVYRPLGQFFFQKISVDSKFQPETFGLWTNSRFRSGRFSRNLKFCFEVFLYFSN